MSEAIKKRRRGGQRGAVLAEFVVALVPLLTIFFVFVQISAIAAARIRFKHAAIVGARCAAVYSNKHHTCPECTTDGEAEVNSAVHAALGSSARGYDSVTVNASAQYRCAVPLGRVICGATSTTTFTEKKSLPHQGAMYTQ
jgi:Flp pilus assembly protein TadG